MKGRLAARNYTFVIVNVVYDDEYWIVHKNIQERKFYRISLNTWNTLMSSIDFTIGRLTFIIWWSKLDLEIIHKNSVKLNFSFDEFFLLDFFFYFWPSVLSLIWNISSAFIVTSALLFLTSMYKSVIIPSKFQLFLSYEIRNFLSFFLKLILILNIN